MLQVFEHGYFSLTLHQPSLSFYAMNYHLAEFKVIWATEFLRSNKTISILQRSLAVNENSFRKAGWLYIFCFFTKGFWFVKLVDPSWVVLSYCILWGQNTKYPRLNVLFFFSFFFLFQSSCITQKLIF